MGFDFCAVIIGLPGFGKTTLQTELIRRHFETTNGIVIAHDPVHQFVKHKCSYYADANAWRVAAAKAAKDKAPMPRGASIGGHDADQVTALVMELAEKLNTADRVTRPILYPSDESSLRDTSGSTFVGKQDNVLLSVRRHGGIGPVFNLQEAGQLMSRFYRGLTDAYLFRQTEDRAYELDKLLFLSKGTLVRAGICQLPRHAYVHVRIGDGIVEDEL